MWISRKTKWVNKKNKNQLIFLVCWSPLSAIFVLGLFMYDFMWFIKLRAWAGMFQSAQVCADVCRCAWVFKGMCGCVQVYASIHKCVPVCVRVCAGVCGWCSGVCGCMRVYAVVHWFVWVYAVHVCMSGMNFQNTYWRLEF